MLLLRGVRPLHHSRAFELVRYGAGAWSSCRDHGKYFNEPWVTLARRNTCRFAYARSARGPTEARGGHALALRHLQGGRHAFDTRTRRDAGGRPITRGPPRHADARMKP